MSANRIVKRTAFADSRQNGHAYWAAHRRGEVSGPRPTYQEYAVASGDRHPDFQKNVRAARAELGLGPTASDMSRVHGRRV